MVVDRGCFCGIVLSDTPVSSEINRLTAVYLVCIDVSNVIVRISTSHQFLTLWGCS